MIKCCMCTEDAIVSFRNTRYVFCKNHYSALEEVLKRYNPTYHMVKFFVATNGTMRINYNESPREFLDENMVNLL